LFTDKLAYAVFCVIVWMLPSLHPVRQYEVVRL